MDGKNYLSLEDAAQYLGLTTSYTYKLVHRGKLAYYKPNHGKLYFTKEDLDTFIQRSRRSADFELVDRATEILNGGARGRRRAVAV